MVWLRAMLLGTTLIATATRAEVADAAAPVDAAAMPSPEIIVTGRAANLIGIADSSSEGTIGKIDLENRPIQRIGELLEVIPGFIATQHSGGGKANQYFLRGFNLDHGTDFAQFIDGVPVNMRTHAHGQGFTDINFIIPEFVDSIDYAKGPYRADVGDFLTAGSAKFKTIDTATPFVTGTGSIDGDYLRLLAGGSRKLGVGDLFLGGEFRYDNGPYEIPGNLKAFNILTKWTGPVGGGTLRASLDAYHVDFRSAEQVPARAIDSGLIGRLGYLDPYLGGKTTRIGASVNWIQDGTTPISALAYVHYYKFKLISNFTYFLDDPVHGDEFEQRDSRFVLGGKVDKRFAFDLGMPIELTIGADTRNDLIAPVGLYHTEFGQITSTVRQDRVDEESVGAFAEATIHPLPNVRVILGLRGDEYAFQVRSSISANSGHATAGIVSPKAAIAWTPVKQIEVYANYGEGFHSNDGRGTTITVSPKDGSPQTPVTPLVKARGYEIGARTRPFSGMTLTATYWWLNLKSELQYQGDGGETSPVGPSKRRGYELSAFYKPVDWLTVDGQYTRSYARETDLPPGADHIVNALENVISAGVVAKYQHASAAIRLRHFGPYPIIEDNSVRARPLTVVNARVGYDFGRVELAVDLINALDAHDYEIEYYYASRLAGEPIEGINDRHLKPIEPRQLRLSATVHF
ncbi:TonB-dependent receptor [Glacieibacterium megasporae]|uniref:TonB-dependent receptor n=1 Tax=Glacieibacterium megasporae TaxID=2835787 RepID=UPI001C1DD1D9|nr:TonB-dependent receptor [Polymorphobacter megasporae]UAJ12754.1 TonB-dependent receptor [Polymorphobacter megasporae]